MIREALGGRYQLDIEIADGGMGTIWVATDLQLKRRVAVKLMKPERLNAPGADALFLQEAQIVARLQHPNVVQIFDFGIHEDAPYFVMELLQGEDFSARLRKQPRRHPAALLPIVAQTARALTAAHNAGIVHRDLKPSNIFLRDAGGDEMVKLLDFGVSVLRAGKGSSDVIAGTPGYMGPEQFRSPKTADHRSDLWSFGVILYRALTGDMPFRAPQYVALLEKIFLRPHSPPSQVVPELGPEVDRFFERALAKDPGARFQSATEMAAAFAAIVERQSEKRTERLLFVDDEPDVAVLLKHRLRPHLRNGTYELAFAANGVEALEQLRRYPDIGVVVTDINMPEMDGLTLLERIGEAHPLVKVIVLSAYSDMPNLRTAMNRGAFDFLVKPIDFTDLEATLQKTVRHVQALRKTVRSTEENSLLKVFVGGGIVDRLLPALRSVGATPSEEISAAVAFLSLHGFVPAPGDPPNVVTHTLNANFEVILPELLSRGASVERIMGNTLFVIHRGQDCIEELAAACVAARHKLWWAAHRAGGDSHFKYSLCGGISAGLVVAGSIGSRPLQRMDYVILGRPVEQAAALNAVAGPSQLLLSEETFRVIAGLFSGEQAGERQLSPTHDSVRMYNLLQEGAADEGEPSRSGARVLPVDAERSESEAHPPASHDSTEADPERTLLLHRKRPV
ncbi:MAG: protein kinase [Polyangiaceae bacterium]